MKKFLKEILILLIIFSIMLAFLTGCSNNLDNDSKELKDKADSEMKFLDTKLLGILNNLNGISFVNYVVSAEQIKSGESTSSGDKEDNSSSGGSSSDESSKDNSQSSSGSKDSGQKSEQSSAVNYSMHENGILSKQGSIDWNSIKYDTEQLYTSWSTVVLDLYKLNINNADILDFSNDLDLATKAVKDENKKDALIMFAKLYAYIPKYLESYSDDSIKINLSKTKSSVLNAYSIIEDNKADDVNKELSNAEQSFLLIINDISANSNKQFNINKAYILIKELQNSVNTQISEVFYIKYKNLMEELSVLE